jgi:hypothetical protein
VMAEPNDAPKSVTVRTFQFKYKDADHAASMIKALLSSDGSFSIQPSANSLVVTDHPENLKAVAAAIADYDTGPRAIKLSIRVVAASRAEAASKLSDDLKDLSKSFSLLGYNAVDPIGTANVDSHEGEPGSVEFSDGYRAEFKFGEYDPASDSIKLSDFKLLRLQNDQLVQVYKTTLNLKNGQTFVLSVKRPAGQRALVIAFAAKR